MITKNELLQAISSLQIACTDNSLVDNSLITQYSEEKTKQQNTITLEYGNTNKVDRVWNGETKDFYPKQLTNNEWKSGLGDRSKWLPYLAENLVKADGKWILWHEGEKATYYALFKGLISTCIVGSGFKDETIINNALKLVSGFDIKGIIYIADNDERGIKKAKYIQKYSYKLNIPFLILPIKEIYTKCNEKDDLADWIIKYPEMTTRIIKNEIESAIDDLSNILADDFLSCKSVEKNKSLVTKESSDNKLPWLEQAMNDLFDGNWISVSGTLYKFNGQFYEQQEDGLIKRKITKWCRNYIDGKGRFSKANPRSVNEIFAWANQSYWISPNEINADGLPMANGILKVEVINDQISITVEPYSPEKYFTYRSDIAYNPNANKTQALDLLKCLDEPYRSLFIQSIATILNPQAIKSRWDRIKALMLVGEGSNGKDTLREVISLILGKKGITGCSLNDFKQADNGRGFSLNRLASNPRINWSSENKEIAIDSIQSLKQAITGDPLFVEAKGKDGMEIELNTLFMFNANKDPKVQGNQKAIQSRISVIPFEKVYSTNPIKGELKANPRYKHDKQFLIDEVCPAMLNLLISAFTSVYKYGINYESSNNYFEQISLENNHLKQFAKDVGLIFSGDEKDAIFCGDIYSHLIEWYHENGFLEFETKGNKVKNIWLDDNGKNDPLVKRSRDLKLRLKEIFPKAKEKRYKNKIAILGVRLTKNAETYIEQEKLDSL